MKPMRARNYVVLFSGGTGSWAAAKRISEMHGTKRLHLLFTDTKTEDSDLYRFIEEAAADVGGNFVKIEDGRNLWEVFDDEKFIGNTRVDICSRILKRDLARTWIEKNFDPKHTSVVLGIDWTEIHRFERAAPRWLPYKLEAPLCDPPLVSKNEMHQNLEDAGIALPRLYEWSPHNNCGGFCVKGGHGQFAALLENMPKRYAYHEAKEEEFRIKYDKDVAILRDRRGGVTKPMTMKTFRERLLGEDSDRAELELDDFGGCGCMIDDGEDY